VGFVQNALKREVYLKGVSNKFGLSEQSFSMSWMFRRRLPRIRIMHSSSRRKKQLPKWRLCLDKKKKILFFDVLFMENKLVDHMLMFGDVVLKRRDGSEEYQITVIEEILHHFEEEI
jgi:DNA primase